MFKKLKYLLNNFDKIKKIVEDYDNLTKKEHKKVSIAGVPDEQKEYIEKNFKINEK
jgi:hypothetical protein